MKRLGSKFIRLGRGSKINDKLIDYIVCSKGRYFVKDVYGGSFEVDKKHFEEIKKYLGNDIERTFN